MLHSGEPIVLRRRSSPSDGEAVYLEIPARAQVIEHQSRPGSAPNEVVDRTVFLIAPPVEPELDDEIIHRERHYRIGSIRHCRDLDGERRGCRCVALN